MNNLDTNISPLVKVTTLENNVELYMKRDDLLPYSFGGNKLRIAHEFFLDIRRKNCNCVICYGSVQSNLCRIITNLSKKFGLECHIISPLDEETYTSNSVLVEIFGGIIHRCLKCEIAQTIEGVINQCTAKGLRPYYIYGNKDGQGNEAVPVAAYVKAYQEINVQSQNMGVEFDYIFCASGTGMTQAGLIVGKHLCNNNTNIVGISVARSREQEIAVLRKYVDAYCEKNGIEPFVPEINFIDKYLCGGYAKVDNRIIACIKEMMSVYGIPLDTTYTGKAFFGMLDYLKENGIRNKKVLFIHTGGTPLFFDDLHSMCSSVKITRNTVDKETLLKFITDSDIEFAPPISHRVDLVSYTNKLYENAELFEAYSNNKLIALIAAYANDNINKHGYITYVYCCKDFRKTGIAGRLMNAVFELFKQKKYKQVSLECSRDNAPAIKLYEKFGFRIQSVQENKIIMESVL